VPTQQTEADSRKKIWEGLLKAIPWVVVGLFLTLASLGAGGVGQGWESVPRVQAEQDRVPVLLAPGWLGKERHLQALRERLLRDGWADDAIFPLEFEDPVGSNRDHARELDAAVYDLLARTGGRWVDVVVHSMGGLALWFLLQQEGQRLPIRRVVFLGSPLQGTLSAHLAWGEGAEEMRPGSPFLEELLSGPPPQRWVDALTIRTPLDLHVVPGSGGTLPGLWDAVVCCPTHQGLLDDEATFQIAREFLVYGTRPGRE
jgi:triacylglycerol lipase